MMETSRRRVPAERARGRWEPGAGAASKIPPELPTEPSEVIGGLSLSVSLAGFVPRYQGAVIVRHR
jgi:hypothetical protein